MGCAQGSDTYIKPGPGEAGKWFEKNYKPKKVRVTHVGGSDAGDLEHLLFGITPDCLRSFLRASDTDRESGRPDWYRGAFPDDWAENENEATGYEICDNIRPYMKSNKWESFSVVEVLAAMACPYVGRAKVFLSHAQAESIYLTYSSMKNAAKVLVSSNQVSTKEDELLFFVDYVCIRQCLKGDFAPNTVSVVISTINHTVLLLGPPQNAWAVGRMWCVFEIVNTMSSNSTMTAMPMLPPQNWAGAMWPFRRQELVTYKDTVNVALQECQAREETDKQMILGLIDALPGGQAGANGVATDAVKKGIDGFVAWGDEWANRLQGQ